MQAIELIIEATGVADPRGLAEPFIAHPLIQKHFPISAIVCLVDSELIEDQLEETEEAINQITFSDIILLNKTDLVSEKYVSSLAIRLNQMNPLAKIIKGNKSNFPEEISRNMKTNGKKAAKDSLILMRDLPQLELVILIAQAKITPP